MTFRLGILALPENAHFLLPTSGCICLVPENTRSWGKIQLLNQDFSQMDNPPCESGFQELNDCLFRKGNTPTSSLPL